MRTRTTLWRLRRGAHDIAECIVRDRRDGRSSLCIMGGDAPSIEVFGSARAALRRAQEIEGEMVREGWREMPLDRPRPLPHAGRS